MAKDFFDRLENLPIFCINVGVYLVPITLLVFLVSWELAELEYYSSNLKHLVKDMPKSTMDKVLNVGDSTLDARIEKYNMMIQDYNQAVSDMRSATGVWTFRGADFSKHYVDPEFAEQIGVKNLKEYKKYIRAYEQDSLATRMRDVYTNQIHGAHVRNNLHHSR